MQILRGSVESSWFDKLRAAATGMQGSHELVRAAIKKVVVHQEKIEPVLARYSNPNRFHFSYGRQHGNNLHERVAAVPSFWPQAIRR
jgi:hypothetical protein